ncbi:MAG: aminoglycoside phosphotransferase family protein [Actinomycetota bacterium]
MNDLVAIARTAFGLEVATPRPVDGSFSSSVLSFLATDERHYVVKQHWARHKAEREIAALRSYHADPYVPELVDVADRDGVLTLLIEGRPGAPWQAAAPMSDEFCVELGRAVAGLHLVEANSFDGQPTWHELLRHNADRYVAMIDESDVTVATQARAVIVRHMDEIPASTQPVIAHFDLRPGNILVLDGTLEAIIDFETARGGHPSLDLFKLWREVPDVFVRMLGAYRSEWVEPAPWGEPDRLERLLWIYAAYNGLAGLAWCHSRDLAHDSFAVEGRTLIEQAASELV